MGRRFADAARAVSNAMGTPLAFFVALALVVVWMVSGPAFRFSSAWQLVINTGTTIATFLMVFLIQNAQNRDQAAIQLKLDELLRAVSEARTAFVRLEDLAPEELDRLRQSFAQLHEQHSEDVERLAQETTAQPADGDSVEKPPASGSSR